jgi:hypothetical protein
MFTGIEIGPSACVVVRTRPDRSGRVGGPTIASARTFEVSNRRALSMALSRTRLDDEFESRARVVAWGPPGSQIAPDLDHLPDVSPLVEAGFEIEAIVSPPQALAMMLESLRVDSRRAAVAAATLTRHGAALAIVHHGQAVAARTFEWSLGVPFSGARSELLDRYLIVSQLAPQLQHLIELAGPVYHAPVSSAVVCGSLPDLRSLSMLLIEELDLEVETLDSTDRLAPAVAQQIESAASLQLAAAAAAETASERQPWLSSSAIRNLAGSVAFVLCAAWASMQVAGFAAASPAFPDGIALVARVESPPVSPMRPVESPPVPSMRPEATIGRVDVEPPLSKETPLPSGRPAVAPRRAAAPADAVAVPVVPPEPLPRVDGIAISATRRLAILDGAIVSPGDRVGSRSVQRVEHDGVVLRERNGVEVFVAIRSRKPPH